jgi:hypothetical protein
MASSKHEAKDTVGDDHQIRELAVGCTLLHEVSSVDRPLLALQFDAVRAGGREPNRRNELQMD